MQSGTVGGERLVERRQSSAPRPTCSESTRATGALLTQDQVAPFFLVNICMHDTTLLPTTKGYRIAPTPSLTSFFHS